MPKPNPAAFDFLQTRRSRPLKLLGLPVPDRDALRPLLRAAARVPDHGKLEPWRFVVLERAVLLRIAGLVPEVGSALGKTSEEIAKAVSQYADAHLAVAVIEVQKPSDKVPPIEQSYSAACVCLGLVNAALASGWGAIWLTGWASHDRGFASAALGLDTHERIAGLIYFGTEIAAPPERPRPDVDAITTWMPQ